MEETTAIVAVIAGGRGLRIGGEKARSADAIHSSRGVSKVMRGSGG